MSRDKDDLPIISYAVGTETISRFLILLAGRRKQMAYFRGGDADFGDSKQDWEAVWDILKGDKTPWKLSIKQSNLDVAQHAFKRARIRILSDSQFTDEHADLGNGA